MRRENEWHVFSFTFNNVRARQNCVLVAPDCTQVLLMNKPEWKIGKTEYSKIPVRTYEILNYHAKIIVCDYKGNCINWAYDDGDLLLTKKHTFEIEIEPRIKRGRILQVCFTGIKYYANH